MPPQLRRRSAGTFGPGVRAEDGIRTRDPHHGKVMLYQLSYFRLLLFTPLLDVC